MVVFEFGFIGFEFRSIGLMDGIILVFIFLVFDWIEFNWFPSRSLLIFVFSFYSLIEIYFNVVYTNLIKVILIIQIIYTISKLFDSTHTVHSSLLTVHCFMLLSYSETVFFDPFAVIIGIEMGL